MTKRQSDYEVEARVFLEGEGEVFVVANRSRFGCCLPAPAASTIWWERMVQLGRFQVARWRGGG